MTFHEMDAAICKRALLTFRLILRRAGPDDSDHISGDWVRVYQATAFELGMPDAISPLIRGTSRERSGESPEVEYQRLSSRII